MQVAAFSSSQNSTVACEMWSLSTPLHVVLVNGLLSFFCYVFSSLVSISNFHRLNFQSLSAPSTENSLETISYIDLAQYVSKAYQSQS